MKFLCTGDWHLDANPIKQKKAELSLNEIIEYCSKIKIEAIIIAGDLWHKKQSFSDGSAVPYGIEYLKKLSKLVNYIFITRGNAAHDESKSISLLHQIEPNIFAFEYPVVLGVYDYLLDDKSEIIIDLLRNPAQKEKLDYIISLIPYPTKSNFISEDSIDNNNANFIEKFEQIFEHIGEITMDYSCPKLLAFHGNVIGSRLSSGQTLVSQDIMVAPSTLQKAKQNYYALSHIHLYQEVAINMIYSSSLYAGNWGETEQKSFQVVTFENGEMMVERVMFLTARPMVKLEASFDAEVGFITKPSEDLNNPVNSEIRYRVTVNENDRRLITEEKIKELEKYFTDDGNDVKIEFNIIPVERESRSEQIMNCKTLVNEVCEYAKVIDHKIDNGVLTKVAELQEGVGI